MIVKDRYKNRRLVATSVIEKYMGIREVDEEGLADLVGAHWRTIYSRKKEPEKWTLKQLWDLCEKLKIPDEEILQIIKGLPGKGTSQ